MAGQNLGSGPYVIRLLSSTGRHVSAVFVIRRDTVELWYQDKCRAVMDRGVLRIWLDGDYHAFVVDDILWAPLNSESTALVIRDSGYWLIPQHHMSALRQRL